MTRLRPSLSPSDSEKKYTNKHGNVSTMNTSNIGRKPKPQEEHHAKWTDRKLAAKAGTSNNLVSELISNNVIDSPTERKVQRGNTVYTQNTANIGRKPKPQEEHHAKWTDRKLAAKAGTSHNFVSELRRSICHPMTVTQHAPTLTVHLLAVLTKHPKVWCPA